MLHPVSCLFDTMDDPRTGNRLLYPLPEIMLAALAAVLSGCRSCEQFAAFAAARLEVLRCYLPYAHGAPSHDTLFALVPAVAARALCPVAGRACRPARPAGRGGGA